jgi:protein-S-isoprenylcysteine O-methyltransferase Ste14
MKTNYFIKHLIGTLFFFSILFISAGRLDYYQGWIYVIIGIIMGILNYTLLRVDPELLAERSRPGEGTKTWDKILLGLSLLLTIAMYVTAGLDSGRNLWSPRFHWSLTMSGIVLTGGGQLMFLVAQKQNKFFSSTVRIQNNREHTVCDTGLYRIIRHPAYAGSVIQCLGFPLLIGSVWSIVPVSLLIIIHITRTALEDKTLLNELTGYKDYSLKTKYRIIPLIW